MHAASPRIAWRGGRGACGRVAFRIRGDGACSRGTGVLCRRGGVPAAPGMHGAFRGSRHAGGMQAAGFSVLARGFALQHGSCATPSPCMRHHRVSHGWGRRGACGGGAFRIRGDGACGRGVRALCRRGGVPGAPGNARCLQGQSPRGRNAGGGGLGACKGFPFATLPIRNACTVHAASPRIAWLGQARRLRRRSVPHSGRWRVRSRWTRFMSAWWRTGRAGHARCLQGQSPRGRNAGGGGHGACEGFSFSYIWHGACVAGALPRRRVALHRHGGRPVAQRRRANHDVRSRLLARRADGGPVGGPHPRPGRLPRHERRADEHVDDRGLPVGRLPGQRAGLGLGDDRLRRRRAEPDTGRQVGVGDGRIHDDVGGRDAGRADRLASDRRLRAGVQG